MDYSRRALERDRTQRTASEQKALLSFKVRMVERGRNGFLGLKQGQDPPIKRSSNVLSWASDIHRRRTILSGSSGIQWKMGPKTSGWIPNCIQWDTGAMASGEILGSIFSIHVSGIWPKMSS
jgi:hypothetical protein